MGTHEILPLAPSSSLPVVVGGNDDKPTSDIKIYHESSKSWKKIASSPSPKTEVAIAKINKNSIIAIGGCANRKTVATANTSSLTTGTSSCYTITRVAVYNYYST